MVDTVGDRKVEENCLNRAIELALKQCGCTKKFAKRLYAGVQDGFKEVDRVRPDFVVLCPPTENEKSTLIGIEHFRVDIHVTQKKTNAVASTAIVQQKNISAFYKEHRKKVLESQHIPQETLNDLAQLLKGRIEAEQKATYSNFIASFEYGLKKHVSHIDAYWENLNSIRGKNDAELGFLIEIHADFDRLYLWHNGKVRKEAGQHTPIFDDVIKLIEKNIDTEKVSFVILYFVETFAPTKERVVIVRTKKIREQLKRQNETIYKYCGDDFRLKPFELPYEKSILEAKCETDSKDENQIEISMSRAETVAQYFEMHLFAAAHQAYCYEKANIPYATTESAFLIIELLRGYVLYWERLQIPGAEWMVYPIMKHYDKATRDKRYEEFKKRWDIGDGENDE